MLTSLILPSSSDGCRTQADTEYVGYAILFLLLPLALALLFLLLLLLLPLLLLPPPFNLSLRPPLVLSSCVVHLNTIGICAHQHEYIWGMGSDIHHHTHPQPLYVTIRNFVIKQPIVSNLTQWIQSNYTVKHWNSDAGKMFSFTFLPADAGAPRWTNGIKGLPLLVLLSALQAQHTFFNL